MRLLTSVILLAISIACIACRGGGITPDPEPTEMDILAVRTASVLRIHCEQSSADPGTLAQVVYPHFGQDEVDANGGYTITVQLPQTTAQVSQAYDEVHINYTKDGKVLLTKAPVSWLGDRVTTPLFSTGAGPNDMVFGNDSLYVANSLDNTVVRYGLAGEVLGTYAFDEGASPSYLGLKDNRLYVVCNGTNQVVAVDAMRLEPFDPAQEFTITAAQVPAPLDPIIYIGPSQPIVVDDLVCVPQSNITSFGPPLTDYFGSLCTCIESSPAGQTLFDDFILEGYNAQFGVFDEQASNLYIVSTGPISFDDNWHPFTTGPSYITNHGYIVYGNGEREFYMQQSVSLGRIGAGRIALDPASTDAALGNSLNGNLYIANLPERTVLRGEDNPIVLTEEFTYVSDVAYTPDGKYILATSFNTDELYVVNAQTDEVNPGPYPAPFDLSLDPELMAGCANIEIDPTPRASGGYDVYVLYGLANAVAKVELF